MDTPQAEATQLPAPGVAATEEQIRGHPIMKRYTGQFVVAMGNGFCTLRCVVGNVPGALCFHGRDSSSELGEKP